MGFVAHLTASVKDFKNQSVKEKKMKYKGNDKCKTCEHPRHIHKGGQGACNVAYANTGCPCEAFVEPAPEVKE